MTRQFSWAMFMALYVTFVATDKICANDPVSSVAKRVNALFGDSEGDVFVLYEEQTEQHRVVRTIMPSMHFKPTVTHDWEGEGWLIREVTNIETGEMAKERSTFTARLYSDREGIDRVFLAENHHNGGSGTELTYEIQPIGERGFRTSLLPVDLEKAASDDWISCDWLPTTAGRVKGIRRYKTSDCVVTWLQSPAEGQSSAPPETTSYSHPLVIAHRGASGVLPEHTLEAVAFAYAQGADYIEQDVVLTKDGVPVVLHDIHLDSVTDVADVFPHKARSDGRFYAIDFQLTEIRQLRVSERFDPENGERIFSNRFPAGKGIFRVPTLAEELDLIQGLNTTTGRNVGIYPEIKSPAFHRSEGQDISSVALAVLNKYGYDSRDDPCFVQCFDASETRRLRDELQTQLRLVQLIGENEWNESDTDYDHLTTVEGVKEIAAYADGIGPWLPQLVEVDAGRARPNNLVSDAHCNGLQVHPYTLRRDDLPEWADSYASLVRFCADALKVDGFFTDHVGDSFQALHPK